MSNNRGDVVSQLGGGIFTPLRGGVKISLVMCTQIHCYSKTMNTRCIFGLANNTTDNHSDNNSMRGRD